MRRLISAESVTHGHPDKLADFISDSVLDAILEQDPLARVAAETFLAKGLALVAGEVTTSADVDVQRIVRNAVREVGYRDAQHGFDADHSAVLIALSAQSHEIQAGVDRAQEASESNDPFDQTGAGDQGIMFGYAVNETPELMPLPITLAHRLAERLAAVRQDGTLPWLLPDGKAQVTIAYDGEHAVAADAVVLSAQHDASIALAELRRELHEHVVVPVLGDSLLTSETKVYINPAGTFTIGGPSADAGLTGRKIIVDTYGGAAPHGGGAFSGKDPTKVDRSASYYARYIAKHVVAAGLAARCQVQLAYAIGQAHPVGIYVDTFGTADLSDAALSRAINRVFDARPAAIIDELKLRRPIYRATSAYGHFGRPGFSWEETPRVAELQAAAARQ